MNRRAALLLICLIVSLAALGQRPKTNELPSKEVLTVRDMADRPETYNGKLIDVRAILTVGWEADTFLIQIPTDSNTKVFSFEEPQIYYYPAKSESREPFGKVTSSCTLNKCPILAVFSGYFHHVPDTKSTSRKIINGAFDPGPLQMEVTEAADVHECTVSRSVTESTGTPNQVTINCP